MGFILFVCAAVLLGVDAGSERRLTRRAKDKTSDVLTSNSSQKDVDELAKVAAKQGEPLAFAIGSAGEIKNHGERKTEVERTNRTSRTEKTELDRRRRRRRRRPLRRIVRHIIRSVRRRRRRNRRRVLPAYWCNQKDCESCQECMKKGLMELADCQGAVRTSRTRQTRTCLKPWSWSLTKTALPFLQKWQPCWKKLVKCGSKTCIQMILCSSPCICDDYKKHTCIWTPAGDYRKLVVKYNPNACASFFDDAGLAQLSSSSQDLNHEDVAANADQESNKSRQTEDVTNWVQRGNAIGKLDETLGAKCVDN